MKERLEECDEGAEVIMCMDHPSIPQVEDKLGGLRFPSGEPLRLVLVNENFDWEIRK